MILLYFSPRELFLASLRRSSGLGAHFFVAQYTLFFVKCKGKLILAKKIFTTMLNSLNIVPCTLAGVTGASEVGCESLLETDF
jgi:hypothetical protein